MASPADPENEPHGPLTVVRLAAMFSAGSPCPGRSNVASQQTDRAGHCYRDRGRRRGADRLAVGKPAGPNLRGTSLRCRALEDQDTPGSAAPVARATDDRG